MKSTLIFDIETNGFLTKCTRMWVMVIHDLTNNKTFHYLEGDLSWKEKIDNCEILAGHNICGYDLVVLKKLFNYVPPKEIRIRDTLILSQILNYNRFGGKHSLEVWGVYLNHLKSKFSAFDEYSPEMLEYCLNDVTLNVKIYNTLVTELSSNLTRISQLGSNPQFLRNYLKAEHTASKWCAEAELYGWPFDTNKAKELFNVLEKELANAHEALDHKLGLKVVAVDKSKGVVEPKFPKWTKAGCYSSHTAEWFQVDPWSGYPGEERMIEGPYSRIEIQKLSLDSVSDVKLFLFRNGWVPTEYNYKVDEATGKKEKTSPKITEDSLEFLGGDGKLYTEFLTTRSRYGVLKTWLDNLSSNSTVHGECMVIGTPSMRARHNIVVNVPGADTPWGKEMRQLFIAKPGWKIIGCDSAGNQARGLAHYLGDKDFIETLLHGDIHQYNADVLTKVLKEDLGVDYTVSRSQAKRILYAFLFGASGAKLWSYIFGVLDVRRGNKLKNGFLKAVPGFKTLIDKLENIYAKTSQYGNGYIPSIVGNRIYVDSFHKLLVYLLQATEKITCVTALHLIANQLEEERIPYQPLIFYHDEIEFMVPEEHAVRSAEIAKEAMKKGPQLYDIMIMDGNSKIGDTWYDVH